MRYTAQDNSSSSCLIFINSKFCKRAPFLRIPSQIEPSNIGNFKAASRFIPNSFRFNYAQCNHCIDAISCGQPYESPTNAAAALASQARGVGGTWRGGRHRRIPGQALHWATARGVSKAAVSASGAPQRGPTQARLRCRA